MTIYAVSVGERRYRVEVRGTQLLVDGEPVTFELTSLNGNGLHLFRRGERSTEMYFKPADTAEQYEVVVNGRPLFARVDNRHRSRSAGRDEVPDCGAGPEAARAEPEAARAGPEATRGCSGRARVTAPMPGLIVEVLVAEGQEVRKGDVLLTQESMKMQMQLRAPVDGRVSSLNVKAGDQVEKGAVLVVVEA